MDKTHTHLRVSSRLLLMMAVVVVMAYIAPTAYGDEESVWIKAQTATLRAEPEFYGEVLLELRYGDEVTRLSEAKGWVKVSAGGYEGFLPVSAITKREVVLSGAVAERSRADSSEVVLAGKGLDQSGGSHKPPKKAGGLLSGALGSLAR